jgi:malate dehydrogenase
MQPDANAPSHRLARVAAHLNPQRPQMEEGASALRLVVCRAKGGAPGFKVAILGAAGGIGQPLSLLMKMNPLVSVLHLYDVVNTPGVTADVSHMDTSAVVTSPPSLVLLSRSVVLYFFGLMTTASVMLLYNRQGIIV